MRGPPYISPDKRRDLNVAATLTLIVVLLPPLVLAAFFLFVR